WTATSPARCCPARESGGSRWPWGWSGGSLEEVEGHPAGGRHLVDHLAVEPRVCPGVAAVPLLEVERHARRPARVAQLPRPVRLHRPPARPALPAADHPVDAVEVQRRERTEQRLGTHP